jgi:hypothetical protein
VTDSEIPDDLERFLSSNIRETSDGDLIPPEEITLDDVAWLDDVVDVTKLNNFALINRYEDAKAKLFERKEALHQTTDEGRELQSIRAACLIEMAKRNLR